LIAEDLKIRDFEASNGWIEKWKARTSVYFTLIHGEAGKVDLTGLSDWQRDVLIAQNSEYDPEDRYNADELGLFYKLFPNRTLAFIGTFLLHCYI